MSWIEGKGGMKDICCITKFHAAFDILWWYIYYSDRHDLCCSSEKKGKILSTWDSYPAMFSNSNVDFYNKWYSTLEEH